MKTLLLILLLAMAHRAVALTLSEKPDNRVSDEAGIFEGATRTRLSQILQDEFTAEKISIYVVTVADLEKTDPVALADEMQRAWITEPVGVVLFYARSHNRITLSLTGTAFQTISSKTKVESLAADIDRYNLEGPARSIPMTISALTELLSTVAEGSDPLVDKPPSPLLIQIPVLIVLAFLAWGLWLFFKFLQQHNVFARSYRLSSFPVAPRFGASNGGSNTATGKFG